MEMWRLRMFQGHNHSHVTGSTLNSRPLAPKPAFPLAVSLPPHRHTVPSQRLHEMWQHTHYFLAISNKCLNFCDCLKQFLQLWFFWALKLHLDFKWPVSWKQTPVPAWKEWMCWPKRSTFHRRRGKGLESTQAWGQHPWKVLERLVHLCSQKA